MYRFFVEHEQIQDGIVRIIGSDVNHMKNVLRFKVGTEVSVCDCDGLEYLCEITSYTEDEAVLTIVQEMPSEAELPVAIHLFQGLPKKDKMEMVIQKSVELGVSSVTPVMMKRSVVKLDHKSAQKKVQRWQSIANAAAKQAKRGIIPEVAMPTSIKDILEKSKEYDMLLVPYENAEGMAFTRKILSDVKKCDKIGVIIGPEGGFAPEEIDLLKQQGAQIISLGKRILRTETAGLAVLSYLMIDAEEA